MTHYDMLGVSREAEPEVIKAAYRALSKKYHPDSTALDKQKAEERMKAINIAYSILSDAQKRAEYDASFTDSPDFDEAGLDDETDSLDEEMRKAWSFSLDYFPDIDLHYQELAKLSRSLANTYRLHLITGKKFDRAQRVANRLEKEYLSRFFGTDAHIREFGKSLILGKHKAAALELNKAVVTFGKSINGTKLVNRIRIKYSIIPEQEKPLDPSSDSTVDLIAAAVFLVTIILIAIATFFAS